MKPIIKFAACILLMGAISFASCKKEKRDTVVVPPSPSITNKPPIAKSGFDRVITLPKDSVTLDGSGSTDPDSNITSYTWIKISGPLSFNIANANAIQTQVINLTQGIYQFELKVTDAGGLFSKDTIQVIVNSTISNSCDTSNRLIVNTQLVTFGTLSEARWNISVASAGNKILFAGGVASTTNPWGGYGSTRVDIYDIVTHIWSTAELSIGRYKMAVAVSGNKILFAGGSDDDADGQGISIAYSNVDIYDVSTDSWSFTSLSGPRRDMVGGAVGNKVFFAGGNSSFTGNSGGFLNVVDIYDVSTSSWSTATLSEARSNLSAVTVGDKIYFAGGISGNSPSPPSVSNRIDIYDNATASWSTSTLYEPKWDMASIAVGNKIFWAGGVNLLSTSDNTNFSSISTALVEIKDVSTQSSSLACLFQPNIWYWNYGESAVLKDNRIVFFLGIISKFDIYDPTTNTWSIGILTQNIENVSIISLNNTIYVAGGTVNGISSNQVWKLEF